jgi:hypothetical protein
MHKISYIADGEALTFAFAFPFFQPADIRVAVNESLIESTEYNLLPNENLIGGNITFPTAPAANSRIDIFRKINLSRFIDYQPTAKIDPENLNADFNFLLEAFKDLDVANIEFTEWKNARDNILRQMEIFNDMIADKTGGAAPLGIFNNLLAVLSTLSPRMINDYGCVADSETEGIDDYGTL